MLIALDFFCHLVLNIVGVFYTSGLGLSAMGRRVEPGSLFSPDLLRANLCIRQDTPKKRQRVMDICVCVCVWVIAEKSVWIACQWLSIVRVVESIFINKESPQEVS